MWIIPFIGCLLCITQLDFKVKGCPQGTCNTHAICTRRNTSDGFCVCREGFNGNGHQCEDIDECRDVHICVNGHCQNFMGGYWCDCNDGFVSDRKHKVCEAKLEEISLTQTMKTEGLSMLLDVTSSTPADDTTLADDNSTHGYNYDATGCNNIYTLTMCERWRDNGRCLSHPDIVLENCRKTCNDCVSDKPCKDENIFLMCDYWQSVGECMAGKKWMSQYCIKSCGLCPESEQLQEEVSTRRKFLIYGLAAGGSALIMIILIVIIIVWGRKSRIKLGKQNTMTYNESYRSPDADGSNHYDSISNVPSHRNSYDSVDYCEEIDRVRQLNRESSTYLTPTYTRRSDPNAEDTNEVIAENRDSSYVYTESLQS